MKQVDESRLPAETLDVYQRLRRGEAGARQRVTEQNVGDLMKLANRDGHTVLATELFEWRANTAPGNDRSSGSPQDTNAG
jgi:hypothetical protein